MVNQDSAMNISRPESFAIKGVLMPLTLLEIRSDNLEIIAKELENKVSSAPDFFLGSAVVISLEMLHAAPFDLLEGVVALSDRLGFRVVGLKGDDEMVEQYASQKQLAYFPSGKVRSTNNEPKTPDMTHSKNVMCGTKTITAPVRSGQQIFSEGDLVVLAPVSAGAELLAVGNIHVYAPMRGRALAGVQGDESVRIFCASQEAELVSIAGHFMIDENLRQANWKSAVQVFFDGQELKVESI